MIDLTSVFTAAITLIFAVMAAFIVPVAKKNLSAQELEELLRWAQIAVTAAQQLYHNLDGSARKEYVREFLKSKGYDVDDKAVDAAIESAVLELHNKLGI